MSDRVEVLVAGDEHAGRRLDAALAGPCGSRSAAQRALAEGRVRVDGEPARKSHVVRPGERLELVAAEAPPPAPARDAPDVDIRHLDDQLLVVDKPAGLVVHAGAGATGPTLVDALRGRADAAPAGGDPGRPGIVHRLDRDTSGLLLVARDEATHRALQGAIAQRRVRREYLALVHGRPDARTGTIEAPIGRDPRHRTRMAVLDGGRDAVTDFAIEEALARTTLLRVRLRTGRTHQIRVHLEAIDLPVVGDPDYGRPGADALGLHRQFLHATRLELDHPVTGARLAVDSPLPADLVGALERARG